ncbi:MAG: glycosyltransferase family 39 protein, partial [Microcoleaceae cyanobacterium]
IAIALIAVSPLHLLYAQEARQYSLWTVTILLSNAAFLRALRVKTTRSWIIYGITMALNLYTHSLSILMGIMHSIYFLGIGGFRQQKILISYFLTWLGIIIAWMPWLWVIIKNLETTHDRVSWMEIKNTKIGLLTSFLKPITLGFIDLTELLKSSHKLIHLFSLIAIFLFLVLIGYSLYFIVRNTSKKSWLFIVLLIGFGGLDFLLVDFIFGGIRSLVPRYLIPYYLGIHLAVTQMIYQKIISPISLQKKLGLGILVMLISSSLISSSVISQQECSSSRQFSCDNIEISRIINKYSEPLIISDDISIPTNLGQLFSLSYKLNPQVRLLLVNSPSQLKQTHLVFPDIFLYNVSPILREEIARSRPFQIQSVYQGNNLKLEKLVPSK